MRSLKRSLTDHWELMAITALAVALRLPYIEERSLWFDEASSWRTASFPLPEMMQSLRMNVHLPLYYLTLRVWMGVFGESVPTLRGLSIACGAITVFLMGLFGRELYGYSIVAEVDAEPGHGSDGDGEDLAPDRICWQARAFGLATAALVAVSPYQVLASIEARMYAVGTMVTALGAYLLLRALRDTAGRWSWAAYGLASIALLYTHHYGLFTVAAQFAFLTLYCVWLLGAGARDEARRLGMRVGIVGAGVALAYVPAAQFLVVQTGRVREDYWIAPLAWRTIPETFGQFLVPVEAPGPAPLWGWAVFVAVAGCVAIVAPRARLGDALVLACMLGPMIASAFVSTVVPVWVPRYFRFAHLFVLTALALAIWRLSRVSRAARLSSFASLTAVFLTANVSFWRALELDSGPGPRGAVARLLDERQGDEPIIVLDLYQYLPIRYYAGRYADVRLVRPSIDPFWGPHVIRSGDLIEAEAIGDLLDRGIWVVGNLPKPLNVTALDGLAPDHSFLVTSYQELHRRTYVNHYVTGAARIWLHGKNDRGAIP
jgi:mannosyltransferase